MSTTDTTEKGLEALIERSLLTEGGYLLGSLADYDKSFCVDTAHLRAFLEATQPDTYAKLGFAAGGHDADKFLKRLSPIRLPSAACSMCYAGASSRMNCWCASTLPVRSVTPTPKPPTIGMPTTFPSPASSTTARPSPICRWT